MFSVFVLSNTKVSADDLVRLNSWVEVILPVEKTAEIYSSPFSTSKIVRAVPNGFTAFTDQVLTDKEGKRWWHLKDFGWVQDHQITKLPESIFLVPPVQNGIPEKDGRQKSRLSLAFLALYPYLRSEMIGTLVWGPKGDKILYEEFRVNSQGIRISPVKVDLVSRNLNGAEIFRIPNAIFPEWSSNEDYLFFLENPVELRKGFYQGIPTIYQLSTKKKVAIATKYFSSTNWHPKELRLAATCEYQGLPTICIFGIAGNLLDFIQPNSPNPKISPVFSPDGQKISYIQTGEKSRFVVFDFSLGKEIFSLEKVVSGFSSSCFEHTLSKPVTWIDNSRLLIVVECAPNPKAGLWLVNIVSKEIKIIPVVMPQNLPFSLAASASSDGLSIAFSIRTFPYGVNSPRVIEEIWVANVDGSMLKKADTGFYPVWQPRIRVGNELPPTEKPKPVPVLLVHGCGGNAGDWQNDGWVKSLKNVASIGSNKKLVNVPLFEGSSEYFPQARVFSVDYSALTDGIEEISVVIPNSLEKIKELTGVKKIGIVTFSMGALLARSYLAGLTPGVEYRSDVTFLYMIAPPNKGVFLLSDSIAGVEVDIARQKIKSLCVQAKQLSPNNQTINGLNRRRMPREVNYLIVSGVLCQSRIVGYHDGVVRRLDTEIPTMIIENKEVKGRHYQGNSYFCNSGQTISDFQEVKAFISEKYKKAANVE